MAKYLFFFLAIGINLQVIAQSLSHYDVGDIVNDFTVTDTQGGTYTLSHLLNQGKYVYIDFFATNCGTCQAKMPIFNGFYDKYGCNAGEVFCVSIVYNNDADNAAVENFEQQYGGNSNHAPAISIDGGAASVVSDFGVMSFPTFSMIAPDGKLLYENISPIYNINDFAATFPSNFNPPVIDCSNLINKEYKDTFDIFPNPVTDFIQLSSTEKYTFDLIIYSLTNRIVFFKHIVNQKNVSVDLNLASGIYILKIQSKNFYQSKKVIIE